MTKIRRGSGNKTESSQENRRKADERVEQGVAAGGTPPPNEHELLEKPPQTASSPALPDAAVAAHPSTQRAPGNERAGPEQRGVLPSGGVEETPGYETLEPGGGAAHFGRAFVRAMDELNVKDPNTLGDGGLDVLYERACEIAFGKKNENDPAASPTRAPPGGDDDNETA